MLSREIRSANEVPYGIPIVRVVRGERTESVHCVATCICDADCNVLRASGSIETRFWVRSVAKPFIAAAVVKNGVVEQYGLAEHEIAVMAGSHCGESFHVAAVRSILEKIGLNENALQCGPQTPELEDAARHITFSYGQPLRVYNNCSGKHAGILALCKATGADVETYYRRDNPAMRYILGFCATMFGEDLGRLPLATDGCGMPVFASTLRSTALAFAKLATLGNVSVEDATALKTVRDAMAAHPAYVRGTGSFDTELISATNGSVVGKIGAEGIHGDAVIELGLGLAMKVLDGSSRALPPVVLHMLRDASALTGVSEEILGAFFRPHVLDSNGRIVGGIEICQ
jgi:L-asparaginase II